MAYSVSSLLKQLLSISYSIPLLKPLCTYVQELPSKNFLFNRYIFFLSFLLLQVQKQSLLSHTAQDSRALWEEELKGRSKLGVRLAELEKEKGELNSLVSKLTPLYTA